MLISIRHVTRYTYPEPAAYSVQSLRLRPPSFRGQRVLSWSLKTSAPGQPLSFIDGFGNAVDLIAINGPHQELLIEAAGEVETENCNGVVRDLVSGAPPRVFLKETPQTLADAAIRALADEVAAKDELAAMHALSERIAEVVPYEKGMTDAHTCAAEALAAGKGVCQDHAHIFIAAARVLEIPARYVTGYLASDVEEESEAHHAWAEAWIEGLGWVGFDVANNVCPTDAYVRLTTGLDAFSAAPITGSRRGGGAEKLTVSVFAHGKAPARQSQSQSQS
jgi:transglutaminase-like putative cysteine protease